MRWNKWIIEMLPLRMRNVRIFALLKVLCSQVVLKYEEFSSFSKSRQRECEIMPNPATLQQVVLDKSGIQILIQEGSGKPYDFIVHTDESDIGKLRHVDSILRKYKQAGKSFGYQSSSIESRALWNTYVCEKELVGASFSRYLCEMREIPVITVTAIPIPGQLGTSYRGMEIQADQPVHANVVVIVKYIPLGSVRASQTALKIPQGGTSFRELFNDNFQQFSVELFPDPSDENYEYKLEIEYIS